LISSTVFNNWTISLISNTLLFQNVNVALSTLFSVEPSGHLCVVGYNDTEGIPAVAAIEKADASGPVYLLRKKTVESVEEDYGVLKCKRDGEGLDCSVDKEEGRGWVACGIRLGMGKAEGVCTSAGVKVVGG